MSDDSSGLLISQRKDRKTKPPRNRQVEAIARGSTTGGRREGGGEKKRNTHTVRETGRKKDRECGQRAEEYGGKSERY